jgi:hypothetical protein
MLAESPTPCRSVADLAWAESITVDAWTDPLVDAMGFDARSDYVERFWLPVLGPCTTLLLRRLADALEGGPRPLTLDVDELAHQLGVGIRSGPTAPLRRSLTRLERFGLARVASGGHGILEVRRALPPLARAQVARLPEELRAAHEAHAAAEAARPGAQVVRQRCRQLALSLVELGEDEPEVLRQLLRWRYHPALAHEATKWAQARHRLARAGAESGIDLGAAPQRSPGSEPCSANATSVRTPKPVAPLAT